MVYFSIIAAAASPNLLATLEIISNCFNLNVLCIYFEYYRYTKILGHLKYCLCSIAFTDSEIKEKVKSEHKRFYNIVFFERNISHTRVPSNQNMFYKEVLRDIKRCLQNYQSQKPKVIVKIGNKRLQYVTINIFPLLHKNSFSISRLKGARDKCPKIDKKMKP